MPVERSTSGASLLDVLDRVLDKGIVIDAWVRVSLVGINVAVEPRVVVETAPKRTNDDGSPQPKKFGNAASSRSAQRTHDDDADQDDES